VYVRSKAAGERVLASLERWLTQRLRLRVNRDKSGVARPWTRKFLGLQCDVGPGSTPARCAGSR
jgi:RNA-directed DNA polymerase